MRNPPLEQLDLPAVASTRAVKVFRDCEQRPFLTCNCARGDCVANTDFARRLVKCLGGFEPIPLRPQEDHSPLPRFWIAAKDFSEARAVPEHLPLALNLSFCRHHYKDVCARLLELANERGGPLLPHFEADDNLLSRDIDVTRQFQFLESLPNHHSITYVAPGFSMYRASQMCPCLMSLFRQVNVGCARYMQAIGLRTVPVFANLCDDDLEFWSETLLPTAEYRLQVAVNLQTLSKSQRELEYAFKRSLSYIRRLRERSRAPHEILLFGASSPSRINGLLGASQGARLSFVSSQPIALARAGKDIERNKVPAIQKRDLMRANCQAYAELFD